MTPSPASHGSGSMNVLGEMPVLRQIQASAALLQALPPPIPDAPFPRATLLLVTRSHPNSFPTESFLTDWLMQQTWKLLWPS